jgi:hypothetical protein
MTPRDFNRGALKHFFERKKVVERQCAVAANMSLKIKTPVGPSNSECSMLDIGMPVDSDSYYSDNWYDFKGKRYFVFDGSAFVVPREFIVKELLVLPNGEIHLVMKERTSD